MVSGGNNCDENPRWVSDGEKSVKDHPSLGFAHLSRLKCLAENARVVEQCHPNTVGITEMHRWHSCQRVDIFPTHPNTLAIIVSDGIEEAIFLGEESWWHTWVEDEDYESEEVREGHRSAND